MDTIQALFLIIALTIAGAGYIYFNMRKEIKRNIENYEVKKLLREIDAKIEKSLKK